MADQAERDRLEKFQDVLGSAEVALLFARSDALTEALREEFGEPMRLEPEEIEGVARASALVVAIDVALDAIQEQTAKITKLLRKDDDSSPPF